jgi:YHS domain-containing protein
MCRILLDHYRRLPMKAWLTAVSSVLLLAACDPGLPPSKGMPPLAGSTGQSDALVKDPVCGMNVDPGKALSEDYKGKKYYFCSDTCHRKFKEAPEKYTAPPMK